LRQGRRPAPAPRPLALQYLADLAVPPAQQQTQAQQQAVQLQARATP
jgi:hypothetical protein